MQKKIVVYTALLGDYDKLHEPKTVFDNCDFICFTNLKTLKSKFWKIKYVELINNDVVLTNRFYKMLSYKFFSDYYASIYIDSNIKVLENPWKLINIYLEDSLMACPKHPLRNCIYDEASECIRTKKNLTELILKQVNYYESSGFPMNYGLCEMNIILRKENQSDVIDLMNAWWSEFVKWKTNRDQLSFFFCLWQKPINFKVINVNFHNFNVFFFQHLHKRANILHRLKRYIKLKIFNLILFLL